MFPRSNGVRRLATAGLIACAALLGASSAQASTATDVALSCKFPLVGAQPITLGVTADAPATGTINAVVQPFEVGVEGAAPVLTSSNVARVTGVARTSSSLHYPSGFVQSSLVIEHPLTTTPGVGFAGSGLTPALVLDEEGVIELELDRVHLNLRAERADGTVVRFPNTVEGDWNPPLPPDSDNNPDTFDVYCAPTATAKRVIASIVVGDGPQDTTPPPAVIAEKPAVTVCPERSVTVRWAMSSDEQSGIAGYRLSRFGQPDVIVPPTQTAYLFTEPLPTQFSASVRAIDGAGNESDPTSVSATVGIADCEGPVNFPLTSSELTSTSVRLSWQPAIPSGPGPLMYEIYANGDYIGAVSDETTSFVANVLSPETDYEFKVEAIALFNGPFRSSSTVSVTTPSDQPQDTTAPNQVVFDPPTITICPTQKVTLNWQPVTDGGGSGLKGYRITVDDEEPVDVTAQANSYTLPNPVYGNVHVEISAVDYAGNVSEPTEDDFDVAIASCPPPMPGALKASDITPTSVLLSWTASTDVGDEPITFSVFRNGVKIATVTGLSFRDTGLAPLTTYSYTVSAKVGDLEGPKAPAITVTTHSVPPPTTLEYALKGSTTLKTLTTGKLPLTGGIKAVPDFAAGTFTADLTLNNTSGRLVAAGFLPITAKVGFVPVGKTTGTLDDATATKPAGITTNSKVRIKVLEVKLFGAIPLAGGNNCQTRQVSDITLKSTNAFDPFKGGSIAGTYKISDLNGCGALNGLVSPLTAGGGNTITLDLAYKG